ncbi:MAG: NnrS family protein [Nitrospira sp.]|nr:NnrS family protein [Nitrospira sp.]
MNDAVERRAAASVTAVFSYGFRPFFLGAACFAGLAVPAWIVMLSLGIGSTGLAAPREWHVHEMLFGFLPAVITGFVLTAVPNWTDRPAIHGRELAGLFGLWLAGRVVMAGPWVPPVFAAIVDAAYLLVLAGILWREIAGGKSWSHAPIGILLSFYAVANLLFHACELNGVATDLPERLALGLDMTLLAFIGGRVTPNFTREFLVQARRPEKPARFTHPDLAAIGMIASASAVWAIWSQGTVAGGLLILAGVLNLVRLSRWYGWCTWQEPLVFVLHWGYAWLVLALILLGCAALGVGLPKEDAVHALTTGAVGVMTLGIMTRASLGHTGRTRHADPATVAMYVLVTCGAILRVFGVGIGLPTGLVLGVAAFCWSGAYLLFAMVYGPYLLRPSQEE